MSHLRNCIFFGCDKQQRIIFVGCIIQTGIIKDKVRCTIFAKVNVVIKPERCKGCELCITVCPKNVLALDDVEVNVQGYHAAKVVDEEACVGCIGCALMCPECAIEIFKEKE